jgi:hypothetical protein
MLLPYPAAIAVPAYPAMPASYRTPYANGPLAGAPIAPALGPIVVVGTADITAGALYGIGATLDGENLILAVNGYAPVTLLFNGATNTANEAAMLAALNAAFPGLSFVQGGPAGNKLVITDNLLGGNISIGAGSTSLVALGLTAAVNQNNGAVAPATVGMRPGAMRAS